MSDFPQQAAPVHAGDDYRTALPGAYLMGAATWAGPGVSGASGRAVAQLLAGAPVQAVF